jgi:ribosomal protein S18 acetylase RimI-like enzyme
MQRLRVKTTNMPSKNFQRMLQLAETVFAAKEDPNQLDVDEQVIVRLQRLHPNTVSEHVDGDGPVAWVLLIPTTTALMQRFLKHEISETELLERTTNDAQFESVYLCSALVLEEFRRKGIVKQLTLSAIESIRQLHPINSLFVWTFSNEGDLSAQKIADLLQLPLYKR